MSNNITDDQWSIYGAAESVNSIQSENEVYHDIVDIKEEIGALDAHFIKKHFAGKTLAGESIRYTWKYGQLHGRLPSMKLRGQSLKAIYYAIYDRYFVYHSEEQLNEVYTAVYGTIHDVFDKPVAAKILLRGSRIISIFKPKASVKRTIKWYERHVYKSQLWQIHQTHKIRDFKPEFRHEDDVYAQQYPEFTREDELQEIYQFIHGLQGRRLSADEELWLSDIKEEISNIVG